MPISNWMLGGMDKPNTISSEAAPLEAARRTRTRVYAARGLPASRRLAPAYLWRMLRDALRPSIRVELDSEDYVCSACGQILSGDIRDMSDHAYRSHGRRSFTFEEEHTADAPGGV